MTLKELCARNVSAGLREVLNAANAAEIDRAAGGERREIDDATADLLATAGECLERAAERLAKRAPKAAEPEPVPVGAAAGPLGAGGGEPAKPAKKK